MLLIKEIAVLDVKINKHPNMCYKRISDAANISILHRWEGKNTPQEQICTQTPIYIKLILFILLTQHTNERKN